MHEYFVGVHLSLFIRATHTLLLAGSLGKCFIRNPFFAELVQLIAAHPGIFQKLIPNRSRNMNCQCDN